MGMAGYSLDKYLELIRKYSAQPEGEPEGALIIFADDAEYIGTNGWFRLKYQNQPDHVFEATPESRQKLIDLITAVQQMGEFIPTRLTSSILSTMLIALTTCSKPKCWLAASIASVLRVNLARHWKRYWLPSKN